MKVKITGIGVFSSGGPWPIEDFKPREHVQERKHLKLMTRGVRLGVAGIRAALEQRPGWEQVPPERRGLFVGSTPGGSDAADLQPAFEAATGPDGFDLAAFGEVGIPRVPPLWLVKGLSNNVLGYASAYHDMQGPNGNRCDGRAGGLASVLDGARAVAEGRADLVVAGGADSLIGVDGWLGIPTGEGAAFFVLEADGPDDAPVIADGGVQWRPDEPLSPVRSTGELGAATGVIDLAKRLEDGDRGFTIRTASRNGTQVWLTVA